MDKKWYKWPQNYKVGMPPWYTIFRRLIFISIATIFLFLTALFIGFGRGYEDGLSFWKHNT